MDNSERIAQIRDILRAGARSVTVDGTTVNYDFEALRRELVALQREDESLRGKRPRVVTLDLRGAW